MKIIKNILGTFCIFMCIGSLSMIKVSGVPASMLTFIIFAILALFLFKTTQKDKLKKIENTNKRREQLKICTMKHINGLPIAEDATCTITSTDDKFIFTSGTMNFELEKTKITDMSIKTDTEIQEQYVSSVGGAVGGAVLFGPLGAVIGGRAKKKTIKRETHNYLIITYQSPDIKYIGFEVGFNLESAMYYIDDFKNKPHSKSNYQL